MCVCVCVCGGGGGLPAWITSQESRRKGQDGDAVSGHLSPASVGTVAK